MLDNYSGIVADEQYGPINSTECGSALHKAARSGVETTDPRGFRCAPVSFWYAHLQSLVVTFPLFRIKEHRGTTFPTPLCNLRFEINGTHYLLTQGF